MRAPLAAALHDAAVAVLLFDYREYSGILGPQPSGPGAEIRAARTSLLEKVQGSAACTPGRTSTRSQPGRAGFRPP